MDYFERRGTPFVVAINCFGGEQQFGPQAVRRALDLDSDVPVLLCDARSRASCKEVLIELVEHVATRQTAAVTAG